MNFTTNINNLPLFRSHINIVCWISCLFFTVKSMIYSLNLKLFVVALIRPFIWDTVPSTICTLWFFYWSFDALFLYFLKVDTLFSTRCVEGLRGYKRITNFCFSYSRSFGNVPTPQNKVIYKIMPNVSTFLSVKFLVSSFKCRPKVSAFAGLD